MAKIKIDNELIEILHSEQGLQIDGETVQYELVRIAEQRFHLLLNNRSYRIEVTGRDNATGQLTFELNGRPYSGKISYRIEQLLKSMGMETGKKIQKEIKAPMPGLVLQVLVQAGSEVKEGDDLLILEAMKMENALKAPQDGVIDKVLVKTSDKVDKNQLLVAYA